MENLFNYYGKSDHMKKLSLLLISFIIIAGCFAQLDSSRCVMFHTGKFSYFDSLNHTIFVTRKANKQVEYNAYTKETVKLKIRWLNDCEYELTQKWSSSKAARKNNGSISLVLITKIIGEADGYEYSCSCRDEENKRKSRGIMRKEP